jgi:4'-phosphopantetheinyl transferase
VSSSDRDTAVRRPAALPFRLHASVTCPPPAELHAAVREHAARAAAVKAATLAPRVRAHALSVTSRVTAAPDDGLIVTTTYRAMRMRTVEVWQAALAQPPELVKNLESVLSDDERERAARLAAAPRWIVARAALRIVLAGHLGLHPSDIEFGSGPHGKPELIGTGPRFNLSHSGDLALIALAENAEVGIDVERTSRRSQAVERTLTEGERATLNEADRHTGLLRIWCRKEALAKALGGGLGWAPETFDTTQPGDFSLSDLLLEDEGYVGAVAVEGHDAEVTLYRVAL